MTIDESTAKIPTVTLGHNPPRAAFYMLGEGRYEALVPQPVTRKGNALKSHRGLASLGDTNAEEDSLKILFHTDLRPDQVHRLEPTLSSLTYLEEATLPSALGAPVTVNLYVSDREIPLAIETLPTRSDYLLRAENVTGRRVRAVHARATHGHVRRRIPRLAQRASCRVALSALDPLRLVPSPQPHSVSSRR